MSTLYTMKIYYIFIFIISLSKYASEDSALRCTEKLRKDFSPCYEHGRCREFTVQSSQVQGQTTRSSQLM